jgi:hypothetical protein
MNEVLRVFIGAGAVTVVTVLLVFTLALLSYAVSTDDKAASLGRAVASAILRVYTVAGVIRLCWEIGAWLRP